MSKPDILLLAGAIWAAIIVWRASQARCKEEEREGARRRGEL